MENAAGAEAFIARSHLGKVQGTSGMGVRHAAATGEKGLLKNAWITPDVLASHGFPQEWKPIGIRTAASGFVADGNVLARRVRFEATAVLAIGRNRPESVA